MVVQVIQAHPIRVVMLKHVGPYDDISPVFDRLFTWVTAHNVPVMRTIGIYWDNPDEVPASRLRSAACVAVPPDFQITDNDGLPLSIDTIPGGSYATTQFIGPYEELKPVWSSFTFYIENTLRRQIGSNPAFEVYVNDPSTTPPEQLVTDLYLPVI